MLRNLINRVAKLEQSLGRKQGTPVILVNGGQTEEQALEMYFQEYPEHRDCKTFIFIHFSQEMAEEHRPGKDPLGRSRGAPVVVMKRGQTKERALEMHFREHPEHRACKSFIFIHVSQEAVAQKERRDDHMKPQGKKQPGTPPEGGAPWSGVKGHGAQRRRDSNDLSAAAPKPAKSAEGGSALSLKLDKNLPFESWDGLFCQRGVWFDKTTLEPVNPYEAIPIQPEKLDIGERRTQILWEGKSYYLQNGWLFSKTTHEAVKI